MRPEIRQRRRQLNRIWKKTHPEQVRRANRERYIRKREQLLQQQRNLKTSDPEKYAALLQKQNEARQRRLQWMKENQPEKYSRYLQHRNESKYLREMRRQGQYSVPRTIRLQGGRKFRGTAAYSKHKLGTADMTSFEVFRKNPEEAVKRDYRAFGIMPIYRKARMDKGK